MSRAVLDKWKRPSRKTMEEIYPSGKPPCDPFPTVTELTNASLCPLAIYHYLHHAEDGAFTPWTAIERWRAGDTYHGFIEHLKESLMDGRIRLVAHEDPSSKISRMWYSFQNFARHLEKPDTFWKEYLDPWAKRKLGDLDAIGPNARIYFETTASCNYVQFRTDDGGVRTYPLTGRIDEIDLEQKRIIERTLKSTPTPKDYQLWLLWKLLCSIDKSKYPAGWRNVDFGGFELVVETPFQDFPVAKNNPDFERLTHQCYAWIHDLTFSPQAVWEAYNERSCNYENRKEECGLAWMCYARKQPNPTCRDEMRRVFKEMYRALLYEKIWSYDLFQYKYATYTDQELESKGLVIKGKTIPNTRRGGTFQIEIPQSQVGLVWTKGSDDIGRFLVVFGNLSIGRIYEATLEKGGQNVFYVNTQANGRIPFSVDPLIAAVGRDFLLFEDRPTHLITALQRDMHRLELRGVKDQARAQRDSKIQLIECIFGRREIRRGRT